MDILQQAAAIAASAERKLDLEQALDAFYQVRGQEIEAARSEREETR